MPEVSIVIVCMDRMDNLYPCLESIYRHTRIPIETFVVAYMFTPEHLAKAREDFPMVTFVESGELRGFSENNNLALRLSKGRYCFVLNDDTELRMDTIDRLVHDFDVLPSSTAIVTPSLVNSDGTLQLCGRPEYPPFKYALQQWHLYSEPIDIRLVEPPFTGSIYKSFNISGAAFLIRTDVFRELGWFDERYYFTPEDIALSTLARRKGYDIYVDAGAEVVHKWRTTASRISPAVRPAAVRGSLIFFSESDSLRYFLLAIAVWSAEFVKYVKALIQGRPMDSRTYHNITRSIFTRRSPKEIFIKYYNEL